jgi:hypothetical protein
MAKSLIGGAKKYKPGLESLKNVDYSYSPLIAKFHRFRRTKFDLTLLE